MRPAIAVITPYCRESLEVLRQCHESVASQGEPADHFLVADGHPQAEVAGWDVEHVVLPQAHGDNGNTPRAVGSILAAARDYEFIAFLDADNWIHPDHLQSLVAACRSTQAPVACAWRTFHQLDGTPMNVVEVDEDACRHVDTSCYLVHRSAFDCLSCWNRMPRELSPICDRVFFKAVTAARHPMAFSRQRTVAFRSQYEKHYRAAGLMPPAGAKSDGIFEPCRSYLSSVEGIHASVDRLGFWPWF
ncbi:MAG: glycosyltransferase [Gammaproteobacteria bacterium]|nr:glycosyltransferase [Gammaproteobacteria bacterium]MBU1530525.1 glycosyltransferase [Gammaproteobacteria bacterium]MBU2286652.1 glycosyltransferase [Gammaproteobacteria bacterium]